MKIPKAKLQGFSFIVIAIACATLAALLVIQAGLKAAPMVPVLQVTSEVMPGDFLQDKVTVVKIAKASVPKGAIKPGADLSKAIAKHGLSPGDILRADHILDDSVDGGLLSARLRALGDSNLRAVELPIDSVAGMLPGMKAGDKVDVIAVFDTPGSNGNEKTSRTILMDRKVIGVRITEDGSGASLVIAVTPQEAETLALYREKGKIYISLKPFGGGHN